MFLHLFSVHTCMPNNNVSVQRNGGFPSDTIQNDCLIFITSVCCSTMDLSPDPLPPPPSPLRRFESRVGISGCRRDPPQLFYERSELLIVGDRKNSTQKNVRRPRCNYWPMNWLKTIVRRTYSSSHLFWRQRSRAIASSVHAAAVGSA